MFELQPYMSQAEKNYLGMYEYVIIFNNKSASEKPCIYNNNKRTLLNAGRCLSEKNELFRDFRNFPSADNWICKFCEGVSVKISWIWRDGEEPERIRWKALLTDNFTTRSRLLKLHTSHVKLEFFVWFLFLSHRERKNVKSLFLWAYLIFPHTILFRCNFTGKIKKLRD